MRTALASVLSPWRTTSPWTPAPPTARSRWLPVDGTTAGAQSLTLKSGTGNVTLGNAGATTRLASLTDNNTTTLTGSSYDANSIGFGALTLADDVTLDTSAANGAISVASVDGTTAGAQSLTLKAGSGNVTLGNAGATTRLGALTDHNATTLDGSSYDANSIAFGALHPRRRRHPGHQCRERCDLGRLGRRHHGGRPVADAEGRLGQRDARQHRRHHAPGFAHRQQRHDPHQLELRRQQHRLRCCHPGRRRHPGHQRRQWCDLGRLGRWHNGGRPVADAEGRLGQRDARKRRRDDTPGFADRLQRNEADRLELRRQQHQLRCADARRRRHPRHQRRQRCDQRRVRRWHGGGQPVADAEVRDRSRHPGQHRRHDTPGFADGQQRDHASRARATMPTTSPSVR